MGSVEEMQIVDETAGVDLSQQYLQSEQAAIPYTDQDVYSQYQYTNASVVPAQSLNGTIPEGDQSRSRNNRENRNKPQAPVESIVIENTSPKGSSSWNFTGCTVGGYVSSLSQEIGFSLWFRCYVFYLLFCNLTFIIVLGTNVLLAAGYRTVIPTTDKGTTFFSPLAMLCMFWSTLTLLAALIFMSVKLIMHWIGFTRTSVNLLLLPSYGSSEESTIRYRDYQLFFFTIAVFFGPLAFSIATTISNEEPFFSIVGNFTFAGFVVFESLVMLIFIYFWWVSFRQKARALRMGSKLKKAAKALDAARYNENERRTEYDGEGSGDEGRRESKATAWHRKKITNPLVMAEFGVDLLSIQAYVIHVLIGIAWVFVTAHPVLGTIDYLWFVITVVIFVGGGLLIWQGFRHKSAKKIAKRQRVVTMVMFIVWGLFIVTSIGGAAATEKGTLALELSIILLLTQALTLRRHDHHVREEHEATVMVLPLSDVYELKEERRRERLGKPSRCIPLLPCSNVWQGCCSRLRCAEPRQLPLDFDNSVHDITSSHDTVMRPIESLGFEIEGEATAVVNSTIPPSNKPPRESYYNRRDRVLTADAMIMTWYLVLFIVFVGMTYGFGDWSTFGLSEPIAATGASYTGSTPYLVCDLRWGTDRSVTIQDFALLVMASHQKQGGAESREATIGRDLTQWFSGGIVLTETSEAARTRLGLSVNPAGSPLLYDKYTLVSDSSDIYVFRDPEFGRSWMRDVDLFSDAAFFDLLSYVNPFFSLWSVSQRKGFVSFTNFIKKPMKGTSEHQFALDQIKTSTGKVFLAGSGMHGAWASIIGSQLEGTKEYSVVSFGSPGSRLTHEKYTSASLISSSVSIIPDNAFLPSIDSHVGFTQKINCGSSMSNVKCQNYKNTLCEILKGCGDTRGRSFTGFEPGVAGFECDLTD